jgi:hypothetical protein
MMAVKSASLSNFFRAGRLVAAMPSQGLCVT